MVQATNLGYPRIGQKRELKKALEQYWSDKLAETALLEQAAALRKQHWLLQQRLGLQHIPANDFSLYDQVLDTIAMLGAIPARYQWNSERVDLHTYFAMARGVEHDQEQATAIPAMEMTKWFDTNYHYIVPEFVRDQQFHLASTKPLDEFLEAKALGIHTRPVLLGPISFLLLGKTHQPDFQPLTLLDRVVPVYEQIINALAQAGADWIQIDEPCLALDLADDVAAILQQTYTRLHASSPDVQLLLATYFGDLGPFLPTVLKLPVAAVHLDLVRVPKQLEHALAVLADSPSTLALSLGVVDGRNVWRTEFDRALALIERGVQALGTERILIGPSCSLLHVPVDLELEARLDDELKTWLAFARQKIEEVVLLTRAGNEGSAAIAEQLAANQQAFEQRRCSPRIHDAAVSQRVQTVTGQVVQRQHSHVERKQQQQTRLHLPLLPTTTIGSFPQTGEVRSARAAHKSGKLSSAEYEDFLRAEIERTIRWQEEIGLDVLVHGEFERSDMVEYFGEQLNGYLFTQYGWVQSYGSRCVRPPIIYGDVTRSAPMTVQWSRYAQTLTERPVKGMLTGPVTMLQWSFVRDDQPRSETCYQLALALHDEVLDLESAGIHLIQIDEPALREGLPLRHADWQTYLVWATNCFRLASSGVRDETQIHTHMCYSEFADIIEQIASMDADVLSIEASRSQLELLHAFVTYHYPNEIGPGVYDIHSPRIPSSQECEDILQQFLHVLPAEQLWVNPDCGLKTRRWEEVRPALTHMVAAAKKVRATLQDC
ncbi:MAG TPA: 5-methyltetrahydropteroyltriglutamate--homocysteine S-methyltransferase [Ktedonobacteraceae bacterium]|jgi:5-methyltetrahydropteroyltriglutamate--homocysteine methyltransferase|nr:5-methyltetrahydropteroyltriglutamate--homocysteine S-methyltransferase [Ktedonobacteraceae bacterium]